MENFPKCEEICKILAACRKAGVSAFKCGALEVTFSRSFESVEPGGEAAPSPQQNSGATPTPVAQVPEEIIQAQQKAEEASHQEQEIVTREQRYAELVITDPLEAERMMEDGDAEPIGENDGEESD